MGFTFAANGPYTPPTPPPTLASFIGYWPATVNMLPWSGSDGKTLYGGHTDFNALDSIGGIIWNTTSGLNPGGNLSIVDTTIPSYDGTLTIQKLVEDTNNSTHSVGLSALICREETGYHPLTYRLMAIVKAAERARVVLRVTSPFSIINVTASVGFDLAGGNTGYDISNDANITIVGQQMVSLGNSFWACIFDFKWNTATTGLGLLGGAFAWCPEILLDSGSGTAARNVTYTGDGTSGVYSSMLSLLPLALWNTRSRVFFDDFNNLSTVDVNNTKTAGFNWYVGGDFPNSSPAGFWHPKPDTLANVFSMYQPSIMQMQTQAPYINESNFNSNASSVVYTSGTGLASLMGNYWAPPLIMDAYFTYDSPQYGFLRDEQHPGGTYLMNNTAFWSASAETLAGSPLDGSGHYLEFDVTDVSGSTSGEGAGAQASPLEWMAPGVQQGSWSFPHTTPANLSEFRRYTGVWLDAASGASGVAGWGLFIFFNNGKFEIHQTNMFAYQTAGASHPAPFGGTVVTGSEIDSQHLMVFLWGTATRVESGPGPACRWDWVAVWQ
jgi:hypothetical protein